MPQTIVELSAQWANPSEVTAVLMIIGGDMVQKALAQCTGTSFTPVCFSFGWVSYAFMALMGILGDGRLLPPPDHPAKVFNLESGYVRENKNWVVGRILRDHERSISRDFRLAGNGIRIVVFEAVEPRKTRRPNTFPYGWLHILGAAIMIVQLGIAAVPIGLYRDWGIMLITASGTALTIWYGWLPQWTVEKLPNRQKATTTFALSSGNGSRDIMVIKGCGKCLDLEEFATPDTPRNGGPWEKLLVGSRRTNSSFRTWTWPGSSGDEWSKNRHGTASFQRRENRSLIWGYKQYVWGVPVRFLTTMFTAVVQSILWLLLLITVAALKSNTWFLVAIGGVGMFQNGILAAMERPPSRRGLHLKRVDVIITKKVMDGLMDLEAQHGCGEALLSEFFPGRIHPKEEAWWNGNREPYDDERCKHQDVRGVPRSRYAPDNSKELGRSLFRRSSTLREVASPLETPRQAAAPEPRLGSVQFFDVGNTAGASRRDTLAPRMQPTRFEPPLPSISNKLAMDGRREMPTIDEISPDWS